MAMVNEFWVRAPNTLWGVPEAVNIVAEAFFSVFALYVLIEFGNYEENCSPGSLTQCGGLYIHESGNMDSSDWLMPCTDILDECQKNPFIYQEIRLRELLKNPIKNKGTTSFSGEIRRISGPSNGLAVMFPWLSTSTESQIAEMSVVTNFFGIPIYHLNPFAPYVTNLSQSGICETFVRGRDVSQNCVKFVTDSSSGLLSPWPCFDNQSHCYGALHITYNVSQSPGSTTLIPPLQGTTGSNTHTTNVLKCLVNAGTGQTDCPLTTSVNEALNGLANEKRVLPRMNLCACINRISKDYSADETCQMVPKIYVLVIWGTFNLILLELTKGTDPEDDVQFMANCCGDLSISSRPGMCIHDGSPRISVARVLGIFVLYVYYVWLWWAFVGNACDAPIFESQVQITEALAFCSLAVCGVMGIFEFGIAILGHVRICPCAPNVKNDEVAVVENATVKALAYPQQVKFLDERGRTRVDFAPTSPTSSTLLKAQPTLSSRLSEEPLRARVGGSAPSGPSSGDTTAASSPKGKGRSSRGRGATGRRVVPA
eukprot:CAMPEP_0206285784 /NCGR_PEP_ID=MMETSP0106_2-20121207/272_1 /ASSEMBLY_ACC=CAM_ASM_000206 /TAXON_ID=81532 /ORGANISM="Acanthoeca-like sp., Strain 10tr" /LENGTH=540 /DNA_ID=CAMNT_0053716303 /DNA_START=174 /DNA_END=1797 /DNA_ORIENTATION=-